MFGARDAIAEGLTHIEQHVIGIEQAVVDNPALAFDLAKTLIESVCKTVLSERSIPYSTEDDLPKLLKTAITYMPMLPPTASGETDVRRSLEQTLRGLSTATQGICELRNQCGFASHGSEAPRPAMDSTQALLAATTTDAIVGFLYRVHRQDRAKTQPAPTVGYDDYANFNDSVDETHGMIQIFDIEFRPSEVLYQMEPESYRVYLAEYDAEANEPEAEEAPQEAAEVIL